MVKEPMPEECCKNDEVIYIVEYLNEWTRMELLCRLFTLNATKSKMERMREHDRRLRLFATTRQRATSV